MTYHASLVNSGESLVRFRLNDQSKNNSVYKNAVQNIMKLNAPSHGLLLPRKIRSLCSLEEHSIPIECFHSRDHP